MVNKIRNLDELLAEKARLRAQIQVVQEELNSSAHRTRESFRLFLDEKLAVPAGLARLVQGNGQQTTEGAVVNALSRMAGMGSWWSGLLAALVPMLTDFVRNQLKRRKEWKTVREAEAGAEESTAKPKPKRRKLFKRKSADSDTDKSES